MSGMAADMLDLSTTAFGGETEHGNTTFDFSAATFAARQALFRQA
jgi:hypothetical protein